MSFRTPEVPRQQIVLWSQLLDDAVPADHPVRHLDLLLHSSAFAVLFREWEGDYVQLEGQPAYHPRDLAALHVYGTQNRLRSSRQLEAACWNRIDIQWLMSGQRPDHSTIAAFVTRHAQRLRELKRTVLEIGIRAGLVTLAHVAHDGTNIEAEAGRKSVRSQESIERQVARLDEAIAAEEAEWAANEKKETAQFGDAAPWAPPAHGTHGQRVKRLEQQQARLMQAVEVIQRRQEEARAAGSRAPKAIAVTSDPDSRVLRDKEGRSKPNFNAQIAVDSSKGMIVADQVSDRAEDSGQLTPLLAQVRENCGKFPAEVSADSQYNTGAELARLEKLEEQGVTALLPDVHTRDGRKPGKAENDAQAQARQEALAAAQRGETLSDEQIQALPRDGQGHILQDAFTYDRAQDEYRCPAGRALPLVGIQQEPSRDGTAERRQYRCGACAACPHAPLCCKNPQRGRTVNRDQYEDLRQRMRARMARPEMRDRYALRKQTVEPRFGHIKRILGVRRFLRRGLANVRAEWGLVCTAVNVGVLLRWWEQVKMVL